MRRIGWSPNTLTLDSDPTDDPAQPNFCYDREKANEN